MHEYDVCSTMKDRKKTFSKSPEIMIELHYYIQELQARSRGIGFSLQAAIDRYKKKKKKKRERESLRDSDRERPCVFLAYDMSYGFEL